MALIRFEGGYGLETTDILWAEATDKQVVFQFGFDSKLIIKADHAAYPAAMKYFKTWTLKSA